MNFYEKINQAEVNIPDRFELTSLQLLDIRRNAPDMFYALSVAFKYGYMQGMKVADAELKKEPEREPKYRNEIRKAIYYHVSQDKNTYALREILKVADIFHRRYDDDKYRTVTDLENDQAAVISLMLRCEDKRAAHNIHTFASVYLDNTGRRH